MGFFGQSIFVADWTETGSKLHALRSDNGNERWAADIGAKNTQLTANVVSSPAVSPDGGTVYIGSLDGTVFAFDATTGVQLWKFETDGAGVESSPVVSSDGKVVYISSTGGAKAGALYALDAQKGTKLWDDGDGEGSSSPALSPDGKTVYVGNTRRKALVAFDAAQGNELWFRPLGGRVRSSPTVSKDGKRLYIGADDENVYAFDAALGIIIWKSLLFIGPLQSSPALSNDGKNLYIGSPGGGLYRLTAKTGKATAVFLTKGAVNSSPALTIDGRVVYIGSASKGAFAIETSTMQARWVFGTGGSVFSSPAIGSDGVIYIGSDDGRVYAIE